MAVIDHPVLERQRIDHNSKYQCWNNDRKESGYWAKNGLIVDEATGQAAYRMTWIKNTMSQECRYDDPEAKHGKPDQRCQGCKHYMVSDYANHVRKAVAAETTAVAAG